MITEEQANKLDKLIENYAEARADQALDGELGTTEESAKAAARKVKRTRKAYKNYVNELTEDG